MELKEIVVYLDGMFKKNLAFDKRFRVFYGEECDIELLTVNHPLSLVYWVDMDDQITINIKIIGRLEWEEALKYGIGIEETFKFIKFNIKLFPEKNMAILKAIGFFKINSKKKD